MSNILTPGLMPNSLNGIQTAFDAGTAGEKSTFQAAVSGGPITEAQALTSGVTGAAVGETRVLSDGTNAGTRVRWYQPAGYSASCWCWDMYPQSQYQG